MGKKQPYIYIYIPQHPWDHKNQVNVGNSIWQFSFPCSLWAFKWNDEVHRKKTGLLSMAEILNHWDVKSLVNSGTNYSPIICCRISCMNCITQKQEVIFAMWAIIKAICLLWSDTTLAQKTLRTILHTSKKMGPAKSTFRSTAKKVFKPWVFIVSFKVAALRSHSQGQGWKTNINCHIPPKKVGLASYVLDGVFESNQKLNPNPKMNLVQLDKWDRYMKSRTKYPKVSSYFSSQRSIRWYTLDLLSGSNHRCEK